MNIHPNAMALAVSCVLCSTGMSAASDIFKGMLPAEISPSVSDGENVTAKTKTIAIDGCILT
ncbi:MAG: hypothetical protein AAFO77_00620 [Pseudomonadota bacterium]